MSHPSESEVPAAPKSRFGPMLEGNQALDLDGLRAATVLFAAEVSAAEIPELYGKNDGKAVGTWVEKAFNLYLGDRYDYAPGNAASGIDFPDLNVDLKATSITQPQSSCPFRDASQKVYGLGYHLLVFVYEKSDDVATQCAALKLRHVLFIDQSKTGDFQTTRGILQILANDGNADDLVAYMEDRNLPVDEVGRAALAGRILDEPPEQGFITISNALQWRLQYGHAIKNADTAEGIDDLLT